MMFYTGEDLTQKHGRLPATNGTLATLNEKKFQKRNSEENMRSSMFPIGTSTTNGRYFGDHDTFYREEAIKESERFDQVRQIEHENGFQNLPDVVSGTAPRNNGSMTFSKTEKFDRNRIIDLRSSNTTPEPRKPETETDKPNSFESGSSAKPMMMRLDLRSMNFDDVEESDSQYTISGKPDSLAAVSDNESETERRVRQKGLKSLTNPEVITFREQSEWLDKLVTEEVKTQKLKKEKESNSTPVTHRFPDPTTKYSSPSTAALSLQHQMTSPSVEESPIDLKNSKAWLKNLTQQGFSPRSNEQMPLISSREEIPTEQITARESFSLHREEERELPYFVMESNFNDITSKESSSLTPSKVTDDEEKRGNVYLMPSKIKETKTTNTSNMMKNISEGFASSPTTTTMSENQIDFINNGGSPCADSVEDDHKPHAVKDRMKAFQSNKTTNSVTASNGRSSPVSAIYGRPNSGKSYHQAALSGDYRYHGNDYDSTKFHSAIAPGQVNQDINSKFNKASVIIAKPATIKIEYNDQNPSTKSPIGTVANQQRQNSSNYGLDDRFGQQNSGVIHNDYSRGQAGSNSNKPAMPLSSSTPPAPLPPTSLPPVEYKKCVKDSRILKEIEEAENRENEIIMQRRITKGSNDKPQLSANFLTPALH